MAKPGKSSSCAARTALRRISTSARGFSERYDSPAPGSPAPRAAESQRSPSPSPAPSPHRIRLRGPFCRVSQTLAYTNKNTELSSGLGVTAGLPHLAALRKLPTPAHYTQHLEQVAWQAPGTLSAPGSMLEALQHAQQGRKGGCEPWTINAVCSLCAKEITQTTVAHQRTRTESTTMETSSKLAWHSKTLRRFLS